MTITQGDKGRGNGKIEREGERCQRWNRNRSIYYAQNGTHRTDPPQQSVIGIGSGWGGWG